MKFSTFVLQIISKMDGERTKNAAYHLLRGKRSGQTIQDVQYYHLYPYFSLFPQLPLEAFQLTMNQLEEDGCINYKERFVQVTERGYEFLKQEQPMRFDGWNYRGGDRVFFRRLALCVQTLSHIRQKQMDFLPIEQDREIQIHIKRFMHSRRENVNELPKRLAFELQHVFQEAKLSTLQNQLITYRFSGAQISGWTWRQLSVVSKKEPLDLQLHMLEAIHCILATIEANNQYPLLTDLATGVKVTTHLTASCSVTKQMFERGMSLESIAAARQLKISTIEDHLIELAINDSTFPIEQFVTRAQIEEVRKLSKQLRTKKLRVLKSHFPTCSYFHIRLILAVRVGEKSE